MDSTELQREVLEEKGRDELTTIATALGGKPGSRARKAEIVDLILDLAGDNGAAVASSNGAPDRSDQPLAEWELAVADDGDSAEVAETTDHDAGRADPRPTDDDGEPTGPGPVGGDRQASERNRPDQQFSESGNRRRRRRGRGPERAPEEAWDGEPVAIEGHLDLRTEGYGFLRTTGFKPSKKDAYVSVKQVRQFDLRRGDRLAGLVGAGPGEVVLADNTSVCLYKAAVAALGVRPDRTRILTDDLNFPSDVQILRAAARAAGPEHEVVVVGSDGVHGPLDGLRAALDDRTALVSLSHVAYRSGWRWDLGDVTGMAHDAGALVLWDLSHSVGAVPIDLGAARADLAVGCTYKYLNGGPGSPAFLYVSADLPELTNPVAGWYGSDDPFDFDFNADRAAGATRFLTGTPPVLSASLVNPGLDLVLEAGMDRLRAKSVALTERFLVLADEYLVERGFEVRSPRDAVRRGSHVALAHPAARAVGQALIHEESVVPDHRPPDLLRFGFAPLYIRFADVDEAVARMVRVVDSGGADRWREPAPVVP